YYGKPTSEELPYIYRSQAKSGTHSFYAYATLILAIALWGKTFWFTYYPLPPVEQILGFLVWMAQES
ncbi:MAG: hypothetical protein V7K96_06870, partial [Nostoc sp.]